MNWKTVIQEWRKLPPEVQKARRLERNAVQTWQSMVFEREPVDLDWLKALQDRQKLPTDSTPRSGG